MFNSGRFGIVFFVVCSVTLAESNILLRDGNNQYTSKQCQGLTDVDSSTCRYGVYRNACEKLACINGAGDTCDGSRQSFRFGTCAQGLTCVCDRCVGCFKKACFMEMGCPNRFIHVKRMKSYPLDYSNNYNEYN